MKNFDLIFTKKFWQSDDYKLVRSRRKAYAILIILVIIAFSYFAGNTIIDYTNDKFAHTESRNEKKINELQKDLQLSYEKQDSMVYEIRNNSKRIDKNSERLDESVEILQKIGNEKNYIGNPTVKQQSDFLSKYRYSEYNGKTGK